MDREAIQLRALLRDGPLSPRAALQVVLAIGAAAEAEGALVAGGRPLGAGAVWLRPDGGVRLQEVGEVDSLSLGALLARLLLGAEDLPTGEDALLAALDRALQQPEIGRDHRHALLSLVRACLSPSPQARPPLHRALRRCEDLLAEAAGAPLAALLCRRQPRDTTGWMDIPDASSGAADIDSLLSPPPPPVPAPTPAPPPAPARPRHAPASAPPASTPPLLLRALGGAVAVLALALAISGYVQRRQEGAREDQGSPAEPPALRGEALLEQYGPDQSTRQLTLISLPEGAEVAVDGEVVGATPPGGLALHLEPGVHQIRLKGPGKAKLEQAVMVDRDARCTWEPAADEAAGSPPWRCEAP